MYTQKIFNVERFDKKSLDSYSEQAKEILKNMALPPFLKICNEYNMPELNNTAHYKKYIILGTGGSSLIGQVIKQIFVADNLYFFDNVDPESFAISELLSHETLLVVISKSGNTLETIAQLSAIPDNFPSENIIIVTQDSDSILKSFSVANCIKCIDHPKDIGGRFSAFTFNGAFPCMIANASVQKFHQGAVSAYENRIEEIADVAACTAMSIKSGLNIMPLITYSDKMRCLMSWLSQLIAESLGKDSIGITPMPVYGTVYQHSQLQLFLDGPKDKFFNVFYKTSSKDEIALGKGKFAVIKNKTMQEIFLAECSAAIKVLSETGLPVRTICVDTLDEYTLGELLSHFMLEIVATAGILGINPYDQPGVEKIKVILRNCLE